MPYHKFRHLSVNHCCDRSKPNDITCAYQIPCWREGAADKGRREGGGLGGRESFLLKLYRLSYIKLFVKAVPFILHKAFC